MLRSLFTARFDDLLVAWRRHHDLRRGGGPYEQLVESRRRLDELRDATYRLRRAFAPHPREAEEAVLTTFCLRFGETVFLYRTDGHDRDGGRVLRCVCGDLIEGAAHPA
jgi:hypothetical protein